MDCEALARRVGYAVRQASRDRAFNKHTSTAQLCKTFFGQLA